MLFILNVFLTFGFTTLSAQEEIPVPQKGILDLRECTLDESSIFDLDGEWLFHWEKLLTPDNFDLHHSTGIHVTVPSYWQSYEIDGSSLSGSGYGTYSLKILLPENHNSPFCVDIPLFDVAYKLFGFHTNTRINNRTVDLIQLLPGPNVD